MTTATAASTVHDVLVKAREELDTRGLNKHRYAAPTGEVCILGAIRLALGGQLVVETYDDDSGEQYATLFEPEGVYELVQDVVNVVQTCIPLDSTYESTWPPGYNDRPETTKDDMLAVLDCAIAKADEQ